LQKKYLNFGDNDRIVLLIMVILLEVLMIIKISSVLFLFIKWCKYGKYKASQAYNGEHQTNHKQIVIRKQSSPQPCQQGAKVQQ
jgi:hypothetical protein